MDNGTRDAKDKKELRRQYILTAPLLPLLVKMAIPTIIGMLVTLVYNLTDTFFIGMLGNKSMTAAIGIAFSFISVIQAIGFWFGYGSGNAMSRSLGESKDEDAETFSSTAVVIAVVSGLILSVFSIVFLNPLSSFIGGSASENLHIFTKEYLEVIAISIPFMLFSLVTYNQFRLCGNVKDGMKGLLSGMLANIVLDPILMFGFKFGFIGAAYATLIGQIIGAAVLFALTGKNGNIALNLKNVRFTRENIYHILVGGLPNFARQGITSLALVLLNMVAAGFSEEVIAAFAVSSRIAAFSYMLVIGWGQGFQPICAMNYGAKQYERVRKAFKYTVSIGTVFMSVSAMLLYVFATSLTMVLSRNTEVINIGTEILRLQCFSLPFMAYFATSSMLMQNIGKYYSSLIISVSRQGIFYIPQLFALPFILGQGGLYMVQPVADVLAFLLAVWVVRNTFKSHSLFYHRST